MMTVEVRLNLPDHVALEAQRAGLLTPDAVERLLRERLRLQAGDALRAMWKRMPSEELTPKIEEMIDKEMQAVHAERRQRQRSAGRRRGYSGRWSALPRPAADERNRQEPKR